MDKSGQERRQYTRFDTEVKIYYRVNYDIKTKVRFRLIDKTKNLIMPPSYFALSKNVSAQGVCFSSERKLNKGDLLHIEIYLPAQKEPVRMEGEVCWSHHLKGDEDKKKIYAGVKLITVEGKSVADSIYFDEEYKVVWSVVLDSIFGSFRKISQNKNIHEKS